MSPSWIFSSRLPLFLANLTWSSDWVCLLGCARGLTRKDCPLMLETLVSVVRLSYLLRVSLNMLATPMLLMFYCLIVGWALIVWGAFVRLLVYGRLRYCWESVEWHPGRRLLLFGLQCVLFWLLFFIWVHYVNRGWVFLALHWILSLRNFVFVPSKSNLYFFWDYW